MGSTDAASFLAVVSIVLICVIVVVVYYVLYIIAYWKIFTKAGEAGWKSIIPFYNLYIQFKISWKTKYFWIALVLLIVGGVVTGIAGEDSGTLLAAIGSLLTVVAAVILLVDYYYLCKSFGHGLGYFIGFLFLSWLFALIVGLGKSAYLGNASDLKKTNEAPRQIV